MNDHSALTPAAKDNDSDYGFLADDFGAHQPAATAGAVADSEPNPTISVRTPNEEPLRAEPRNKDSLHAEHESSDAFASTQASPPMGLTRQEKTKYGLIIGVAGVTLFALLVWLAIGVMSPPSAPSKPKLINFEERTFRPGSITTEPQIEVVPRRVPPVIKEALTSSIVDQGSEAKESLTVAPVRTSQEDDEAFYDNMAKAAGQQPIESQGSSFMGSEPQRNKLTPQEVDLTGTHQYETISLDLKKNNAQLLQVMDALERMSSEVSSLKTQVQSDSEQSRKYSTQIEAISDRLNALTIKSDERFKAITSNAVAAAIAAVKKQGAPAKAGNGKMVLVGGPKIPTKPVEKAMPKDLVQVRSTVKNQSSTSSTYTVAKNGSNNIAQNTNLPAPKTVTGCGAKVISQNWAVKGVSASAAYIRRTDGEGVMVRVDMEVPGFGTVKSFDPNARTVCTTSGLIVR